MNEKKAAEKWIIFTKEETYFIFNIHQVSKLENQFRKQGVKYRTIYYLNNKPVTYEIGQGYQEMSSNEEMEIIRDVQPVVEEIKEVEELKTVDTTEDKLSNNNDDDETERGEIDAISKHRSVRE